MAKILIVEDDKELSHITELELTHEGFSVVMAADGREGFEKIQGENPDLVLLDVMLPRLSGLEILRKVRNELNSDLPIILVTARGETIDKVDGLNSGADDYIAKPFKIEELLARMKAVLRRTQKKSSAKSVVLKNGSLEMVADEMRVNFDGEAVELSKNEFLLLKYFLENAGKILSRDDIIKKVWGEDYYIEENSVDVYVRHLRSKFGDGIIKTVRGMGYIMQEVEK
ncbi:MAG: response regulator transcription factor [Treponema sp.]|uniref:response regulator transcription factor n=1 Tax=Treponema sp. TaxID=166 RepID=UPI0025D8B069|nr:response regulator transcription factor [Treponema sp.]MBQ8679570.1 response regulator transcription factor [Treponema sp.]